MASDGSPAEIDFATAAAPTLIVKIASGALMIAGLSSALVGVQTLVSFVLEGPVLVATVTMLAGGAVTIVVGWMIGRARAWAALVGLCLSLLLLFGGGAWVFFTFGSGIFSLMALLAPMGAVLSTVLVPLAIPGCRRATAARRRLQSEGLDIGI